MNGGAHETIKVHRLFNPLSRATENTLYNLDTAIGDAVGVDLQGFDECLIAIFVGAAASGYSGAYQVMTADINDLEHASAATVTGATATIADTEDGSIELIRIRCRDVGRYLFLRRIQTGAVAAVESVVAMVTKHSASSVPVTQPAAAGDLGPTRIAFAHAT